MTWMRFPRYLAFVREIHRSWDGFSSQVSVDFYTKNGDLSMPRLQ